MGASGHSVINDSEQRSPYDGHDLVQAEDHDQCAFCLHWPEQHAGEGYCCVDGCYLDVSHDGPCEAYDHSRAKEDARNA